MQKTNENCYCYNQIEVINNNSNKSLKISNSTGGERNRSSRIQYLDIAKGILIILLVFAHFRSAMIRLPYESEYFKYVYGWNNIFTCFYMPAFFFISGFCSNFNKSCKSFVVSLIKQLILPLFTLSIIGKVLSVLFISHTELLPELLAVLKAGGTLWFLQALIICKIICFIGSKVVRSRVVLLIISFIFLVVGVSLNQFSIGESFFFYKHAFVAVFFMAFGYYLRENQILYDKCLKWSLYLYPFVAIATFVFEPSLTASLSVSLKSIPIFIGFSTIGTMFLLQICKKIQSNRILEYWGQNSLVVYGIHFTPLICFFKLYYGLLQPDSSISFIVFIIVLFMSVYAVCFAAMKLFEYKPFKWLMGKF